MDRHRIAGWMQPTSNQPVLVVDLDAPGLDGKLVLDGHERYLAARAAQNLWLPYRVGRDFLTPGLRLGSIRDRGAIDPALLAAAAQLLCEVALRWSRQHSS